VVEFAQIQEGETAYMAGSTHILKKVHVMEVVQHAAAYLLVAADDYPEVADEMRTLAARLSALAQDVAALPARDRSD
jgi:hypothetical protein